MLFKCLFCQRTFSRRTAYTQHKNRCLLTVESSEESSEYEKNTLENKKIKKFSKEYKKNKKDDNNNNITSEYFKVTNNQLESNSENYKNDYKLFESTPNDDFDILVSIFLKNYNFKK